MVGIPESCRLCTTEESPFAPISGFINKINTNLPITLPEEEEGESDKICHKCVFDLLLLDKVIKKYKNFTSIPADNRCYLCLKENINFNVTGELFRPIRIVEDSLTIKNILPRHGVIGQDVWRKVKKRLRNRKICNHCYFLIDSVNNLYYRVRDIDIELKRVIRASRSVELTVAEGGEENNNGEGSESEEAGGESEEESEGGDGSGLEDENAIKEEDEDEDEDEEDYDVKDVNAIKKEVKEEVDSEVSDLTEDEDDEIDQNALIRRIKAEKNKGTDDEEDEIANEEESNDTEASEDVAKGRKLKASPKKKNKQNTSKGKSNQKKRQSDMNEEDEEEDELEEGEVVRQPVKKRGKKPNSEKNIPKRRGRKNKDVEEEEEEDNEAVQIKEEPEDVDEDCLIEDDNADQNSAIEETSTSRGKLTKGKNSKRKRSQITQDNEEEEEGLEEGEVVQQPVKKRGRKPTSEKSIPKKKGGKGKDVEEHLEVEIKKEPEDNQEYEEGLVDEQCFSVSKVQKTQMTIEEEPLEDVSAMENEENSGKDRSCSWCSASLSADVQGYLCSPCDQKHKRATAGLSAGRTCRVIVADIKSTGDYNKQCGAADNGGDQSSQGEKPLNESQSPGKAKELATNSDRKRKRRTSNSSSASSNKDTTEETAKDVESGSDKEIEISSKRPKQSANSEQAVSKSVSENCPVPISVKSKNLDLTEDKASYFEKSNTNGLHETNVPRKPVNNSNNGESDVLHESMISNNHNAEDGSEFNGGSSTLDSRQSEEDDINE